MPNRLTDAAAASERSPAAAKADELLHILQRRWRTVLAVVVFVAAVSYGYSASQKPRYAASADVLLSRQNLAASVNNITDTGVVGGDFNRIAQTEANLATAPAVISLTLRSLGLPQSDADELQANATVTAKPTADILTFRVLDGDAAKAVRLAAAYARSYTVYRRTLDSTGVDHALKGVRARLATARAARPRSNTLITSLRTNEDRLSTLSAFQGARAFVIRSPREAVKASPKPRLALILGLFFGALIGVAAVLVRNRLDTRVRDPDEVAEQLGLPLLATIPDLSRKLRQSRELVMLSQPDGMSAEAFRMLRTNVEFASIDGDTKTVMVSSALQAEGKSTTVANLAIAFARGGKRVILVDLDLRRPYLAKFFGLEDRPGISEVALRRVAISDALCEIDLSTPGAAPTAASASNGTASSTARKRYARAGLRVLTSGPMPPDTGEFVASDRIKAILADLELDADIVLIDAPPMLTVNDALALSHLTGGLFLVARLGIVRRPMFKHLRRILERCPARVLGCVVTGAPTSVAYGYQYGYGYSSTNKALEPAKTEAPTGKQRLPTP